MKPQAEALLQAALRVRENAYAPYSHFCVGAALLGADGVVYTGWYKTDDGKTYYFDMIFAYLATGYTRIGKDSYFYFNPDGEPGGTLGQLMTGSIKVEDKLYFFDRESGLRVSTPGWYDVNGDGSEVYYIKDDFSLATGWLTIPNDNNTYYFDPDTGKMVSEKTVIG